MAKEWTDDEVQAEIREAVAIVRADRLEKDIRARFSPPTNDPPNPGNGAPPSGGTNPDNDGKPPKRKGSLFWGTDPDLSSNANRTTTKGRAK